MPGDRNAAGGLWSHFREEDGGPRLVVPSWPHFPQGARRLGEGLGLCREASLQD